MATTRIGYVDIRHPGLKATASIPEAALPAHLKRGWLAGSPPDPAPSRATVRAQAQASSELAPPPIDGHPAANTVPQGTDTTPNQED